MIFFPLSFLIGIAASAIGFTAWSLIVPVLFVLFDFNLYLTIYISLLVDFGNAVVMTLIAAKKHRVDIRQGLKLGVIACLVVIPGIYVGTTFIPQNTDFFKGSVGIFNLLLGIIFILRGYKKGKNEKANNQGMDQGSKENMDSKRETHTIKKPSNSVRTKLIYLGVAFMAIQTGLIGIGGGMGYAIFLMLCLSFSTLRATGTAMLITCCAAFVASFGILFQIPNGIIMDNDVIKIICFIVGMSALGTIVGARIAYSLSEQKVNYLIGGIVIFASLLATAQGLVLN